MQTWSPLWRWVALGVLAALTIAWLAQTEGRGREGPFAGHRTATAAPVAIGQPAACAPGSTAVIVGGRGAGATQQVCVNAPGATVLVNGDGSVAVAGSSTATNPGPTSIARLRERAELQRQEARLQAQQARLAAQQAQQQTQLQAQIAALQARLGSLGQ